MTDFIPIRKMSEILLEEFMLPMDLSAYRLAQEIHVPVSRIQDILHDRRKITPDTSLRLARFFGVPDSYFLDMQNDIDIRELKSSINNDIADIKPFREEVLAMSDSLLTTEELQSILHSLLIKYHAEAAILFGSYARKEANNLSDIDVVIIGGADFEPTDVFGLADDLHRLTNKEVDVYELCEIDQQSEFYQTILREGVRIAA